MQLKSIPRRLGYILGAQWTRDASWTVFTILLARRSPDILGQIVLALTYGYLVKTVADVGLNDYLLSTFARREERPRRLLSQVSWLKMLIFACALFLTWLITGWQQYSHELRLVVMAVCFGLGMDAVCDSFFALCQARGRQDVEMRIRVPAALIGIGYGIFCVVAGLPPICIALFKPIEALLCVGLVIFAMGHNPLSKIGKNGLIDLAIKMKSGIIFTCMAACTMFYNKVNVIFLKKYGTNADVGGYGVAWETVEGVSVLVSSALLGKVIFPLLAKLWSENRIQFRQLAGQTARSLWAAALLAIFILCVESDRYLPFIYGQQYGEAVRAQQLLTPCLATAFLHNLAAYVMISIRRHVLLLCFYLSGLVLNIACCLFLIPMWPLDGAALSLTITKVWVAILTVGFFQYRVKPMNGSQWLLMLAAGCSSVFMWYSLHQIGGRELAELAGLLPLLALMWYWRPPAIFEREKSNE